MSEPTSLEAWLAYCERIHPQSIDMGLERVAQVAGAMGLKFSCPVITVAGTNGKGSTCAMLDAILQAAGYRTGMYTSPHLVDFEERCKISGEHVDASKLVAAFSMVESSRCNFEPQISLTYFEFTTLAILKVLADENLDVVVLEVGMGGRLDAVNVIDSDCAIITSIDVDHSAFLGNDREQIGREKAGIMRTGRPVVVSDPRPPQSVLDHAEKIGALLLRQGVDFSFGGDAQQWAWVGLQRRYSGLAYPALRGVNQLLNASGALAALAVLRERLPITAQAVRQGLALVSHPARFQIVPGNPVLVLDVAHNPHAVAALAQNLDAMGFYPATHAVVGMMADKAVAEVIGRMLPLVEHWYFTDLPTPRAASAAQLLAHWQAISTRKEVSAQTWTSPQLALDAAVAAADPADRIVVFGSFYTVGGVLKNGLPRLNAKHLTSEVSHQA